MPRIPDAVIIVDQKREMTAIKECRKLNIPIISILDTNCDPDLVDIQFQVTMMLYVLLN